MAKTKAELEADIVGLNEIIAEQANALADKGITGEHTTNEVVFSRNLEHVRCVNIAIGGELHCVEAEQWIDAMARMSAGGANSENQAAARNLHLG